jgi:hypothetical protein
VSIISNIGGIVMKKFIIEDSFWSLFPSVKSGTSKISILDINNKELVIE